MSHDEIVERWLDTLEGKTDARGRQLTNPRGANVYAEGTTLYSYGRHFPLAEYYPRDRRRRTPLFLLNGDRVSVTTSQHQSTARAAIQRRAWPYGSANATAHVLILPFSALDGAGIDRATILPLDIREDRWETVDECPVPAGVDLRDVTTAHETAPYAWTRYSHAGENEQREATRYYWRAAGYVFHRTDYGDGPTAPVVDEYPPGAPRELDGWDRLYRREHRLGDSLFTGETRHTRTIRRPVAVRDVVRAAVRSIEHRRAWDYAPGHGLDVVETLDNVNVDEPIVETATVRRRRRYVSAFDANEPAPLYFLATLPSASRAQTVASAIDDLAPTAVHAAIARGRHVERQGDIFAIETDTHDAALAGYPRARLTLETRGARPRPGEPGYVAPLTADERRRILRRARALWRKRWTMPALEPATPAGTRRKCRRHVSIAERQLDKARARARSAILAPFPNGAVYGRQERYAPSFRAFAYDATRARETLHSARRDVQLERNRRGAIRDKSYRYRSSIYGGTRALELWRQCVTDATHELRPALRPDAVDRRRRETRAILSIHGTAHSATEVVRAPGGRVYIRGAMVHSPQIVGEGRERDHIRRPLKPGVWYLAVRNTVPRASADTNGRRQ